MISTGNKKKVFVGLSGGVDSSVSAALLKRDGYDVTGVFIKAWHPDFLTCTWKEDRLDAMRVCATLDIPFLTFDFEKEYKKEVIDYMLREYALGNTPNPDVMCNKHVKFGVFFNKAREMGADYVATGHYAQVVASADAEGSIYYKMLEGKDSNKDQTYFLWTLTQAELAHTLFPVGEYEKKDVRKLAEEFGLPTYAKKDSQGLCFLGKVDLKDFLKHYFKEQKGEVVTEKGKVIGEHEGVWFYTIGERHNFTVFSESPDEKPYYVVSKDIKNNKLVVSNKVSPDALLQPIKKITITNVNWITEMPTSQTLVRGRVRYRQELIPCSVQIEKEDTIVEFKTPQSIMSSGQSIVFYSGSECLGGAVISSVALMSE